VASVEGDGTRSPFSNYGSHVSVCAPGSNLLGAHYDGGFARWSGTSFAAPLVSAQAALLTALRPERRGSEVAQRIRATALRIDSLNPLSVNQLGAGLIQLGQSLW
jgi:thermitase